MEKQDKITRYRQLNQTARKGQIVFAGSSLMEMFPIEQFVAEDNLPVVVYNRGIGGFVTDELLANLAVCVLDLAPRMLFLNIGTNDLSDASRPMAQIMGTYRAILEKDEHGRLRAEFTYEGMHIRPEGYRTIYPAIKEILMNA